MQIIIATIKPGETGPHVANLQDALLRILERRLVRTFPDPNRPTVAEVQGLTEGLKQERGGSVFGDATTSLVAYFQVQEGLGDHLRGVVEDATAARLNEVIRGLGLLDDSGAEGFVVTGHVTGAGPGYRVRAYDSDFRSEEFLGESSIDDLGKFEIRYSAEQFKRAEKGSADLRVAACEAGGRELVSSAVVFNAGPKAEINLTIGRAADAAVPSEYERYLADLGEVLQGVTLGDAASGKPEEVERDLNFLAGDTGIDRQHIAWLFRAATLSLESGIPPEAFYGWLRQGQPSQWDALRAVPVSTLRAALLAALDRDLIPRSVRDRIDEILDKVPNAEWKGLADLVGVSSLPPDRMRTVLGSADGIDAVSDELLSRLVEDKTLAAPEAERLGLTVSLHRMAGPDPAVVSAMLDAEFPSLKTGKLAHARDLAALEPDEWQRALEAAKAPVPQGVSFPAFARTLAMEAAAAYPDHAFRQRAARVPAGLDQQLERIQPVLRRNEGALARDFDELDIDNAADRDTLRAAHGALRDLANSHPGLGLHEALAKAGGGAQAAKVVAERIGWLNTVLDRNPGVAFLDLDYLPDSVELATLDFATLPDGARERVVADLKAHQRIHAVTGNVIPARELMKAGFDSASAIALTPEAEFAAKSGLPAPEARAYRAKAVGRANEAAVNWFSIYDQVRDQAATPVRAIPSRQQFFKPLEGFTQLVNDQPWCACEKCQSVLSPAAYFVDLMYYIEESILKGSFRGQETHPLHLEKRRPDLWELPLTCENTTDFIPSLDLVNEILERYVKEAEPLDSATPVYKHLAQQDGSFDQPFTLPIDRLEILLGHFGLSRYDISRAMQAGRGAQVRARLNMSVMEYALITTERHADAPFLRRMFKLGTGGNVTAPDVVLAPMEMAALLRATALEHGAAEAVLKTTFIGVDGSTTPAVQVVLGKRDPQDVQNNSEVVKNLTLRRLDRLHRFVRLWRKLPWTIEELDHVLARLAGASPFGRIDPETNLASGTLERILDLLDLNADWSLPVEELIALSDAFPAKGLREPASLFDRLFNQPAFVARDGLWKPDTTGRFTHPAWPRSSAAGPAASPAGVSAPANNTLTRLLAGLQLTDGQFVELIAGMGTFGAVDHQPATATAPESISLSRDSIGALYRHARLRSLLGRTVTDFLKILKLAPLAPAAPTDSAGYILDIDDVRNVVEFAAWQKTSGFSLDEIAYLIGGRRPDGFPDATALAGEIVDTVKSEKSLEFADTVFTEIGLTEAQSRVTVAANLSTLPGDAKPFEALPDGTSYRLRAGAGAVTTPVAVDALALSNLLGKYDAQHVLDVALGSALRLSPEEVEELRNLADPMAAADAAAVTRAMQGGNTATDRVRLTNLIATTLRFHALFKSAVFDLRGLKFARREPTVFFDSTASLANRAITTAMIRNVAAHVALATATDSGFTTASGPADLDAVEAVVTGLAAASDANVARALRTGEARIGALRPHLQALPANVFDALAVVARCLALTKQLGVSGETLKLMVTESTPAETFDRLSRAAEDVFGAFRAKYPKEKTFKEKLEPYEDKLRARKRDGLVHHIITRWPEPFSDPGKLYEYFLVDVMVQGCARTSRVVAATTSLQLYVHRVLMNLERSGDWDGQAPPRVGVYARFTEADAPARGTAKRREWQWRQHYRVWEANRKVFLYPENYIEPELRDDKTPLFEELEDTLLVQEISASNVHDAYSRYLTGFDELARLKIAGAYYDETRKTLHLFGVTQDDAPVYYYRAVDQFGSTSSKTVPPRFSAWQKLSLQIPVRKVSPILFEGRLYLFWLETTTRPVNIFKGGTSDFGGYRHTVRIKYSTLRLDGAWSSPQLINFVESGGTAESRIVEDPLDTSVVDRLAKDLADKRQELGILQTHKSAAQTVANAVAGIAADATEDREGKEIAFRASPVPVFEAPLEIALAIAVEAGAGSTELDVIRAIFRPIQFGLWLAAIGIENGWLETLRGSNLVLARASDEVRIAEEDVRRLTNELSITKVLVRWDKSRRDHKDALDSYKPAGWEWDRVYPDVHGGGIRLTLVPRNPEPLPPPAEPEPVVDVLELKPAAFDPNPGFLREIPEAGATQQLPASPNWSNGLAQLVPAPALHNATYAGQRFYAATFRLNQRLLTGSVVAQGPPTSDVQSVNGEPDSMIIESQGDSVWMRRSGARYDGIRLGTGLTATLAREFWRDGASSLLEAEFQGGLQEIRSKFTPVIGQSDPKRLNPFHPDNPCLTYFREAFFHIPFLVANHLNSQQDFAETQRWYHHIFDPTAAIGDPWRYREFREPDKLTTSLRQVLTDRQALDAYRKDPFSPHAIARTRLSAYQKSIVMKYIDNLLDWADSLFNQFTMESINEATMLYMMAQDILGPRPQVLGSCGEGKASPKNYRTIRAGLKDVSDFLVELEAPAPAKKFPYQRREAEVKLVVTLTQTSAQASTMASAPGAPPGAPPSMGLPGAGGPVQSPLAIRESRKSRGTYWSSDGGTSLAEVRDLGGSGEDGIRTVLGSNTAPPPIPASRGGNIDFVNPGSRFAGGHVGVRGGDTITAFGDLTGRHSVGPLDITHDLRDQYEPGFLEIVPVFEHFEYDPVALVPPKDAVFCIPPNKDLLAYWGRVEDRLFKIRNCMDISGVRRRLELFAPEIDPRLLVRMKAAGLSLDDVLNSTSGNLPPYRFTFLIDKAKQYAGTVQSFGAQLLSALEKRDAEELSHLRSVHEQNLLTMRTKMTQLEITAAEDALEGLRRQKEALEYKRDHFVSLSEVGQISQERKQHQLQREAAGYRTAAGIAQVVASILTIIPDVGAPTSMKFGGSQLGASGKAVAEGLNALAAFHDTGASMAGVEASNQRRDQEWKHQIETAKREIAQIEKSITAAAIKRDIAVQALDVHEQAVAQTEEMFDFLREKFSSVDRYRLLSTELRRLYRLAFNAALAMARMAEQAYRAERTEDDALLGASYWDAESAGLLAGERLLIDLQRFERQFIEGNYRQLEVEQSFSLAQFAPEDLAALRLTGQCEFTVPEWFFDLSYPGHYRRRLKAVRLTIPCVTGPYANVGATLRLDRSEIRLTLPEPAADPLGPLTPVPLRHTVSIATSKAQNDSGVFDFNFRDERYMPFEGAGAIGSWQLSLPKTIRVFDYGTISDVILHLSYTADHDERLRQRWDGAAQELIDLLSDDDPTKDPPMTRVLSLRHEFPDVFHRLVTSPVDTGIGFTIEPRHFPIFLAGRTLEAATASLRIVSSLAGLVGTTVAIGRKAAGSTTQAFKDAPGPATPEATGAGLGDFDCGDVFQESVGAAGMSASLVGDYVIKVKTAGPLASTVSGAGAVDPGTLHDIVLKVGYRLARPAP